MQNNKACKFENISTNNHKKNKDKALETKPLVNITMPVCNRFYSTQMALLALHKLNRTIPFSVTVVDNGSEKDLQDRLIELAENKIINKLFLLGKNMGISCACNIGWRSVDAQYYVKLDNDVIVRNRNFIIELINLLQYIPPFSTLGSLPGNMRFDDCVEIKETPLGLLGKCTTNLPGCGLVIPKIVSDSIGYFNEDYGLYGAEDGDYGLRMNAAGFSQYYYDPNKYYETMYNPENEKKYTVNRSREYSRLFFEKDGIIGYFPLNNFLYNYCIRRWNIPPRYKLKHLEGYHYEVVERSEYSKIRNALLQSQKIIDSMIKRQNHISYGEVFPLDVLIEKLKAIWKECGEECAIENMINNQDGYEIL